MKLIEADKVEQAIKDYWKAQVDKLPIPKSIEEHDERVNRLDAILEHNDGLLKEIEALPSAEPDTTTHDSIPAETGKNDGDRTSGDCISRQQAIDALKEKVFHNLSDEFYGAMQVLDELPSAQPERTCVNCGRTANNGGWYADGGTRCPIEEHYALPKDGFCHLWEKRNVTDDDYPERMEE